MWIHARRFLIVGLAITVPTLGCDSSKPDRPKPQASNTWPAKPKPEPKSAIPSRDRSPAATDDESDEPIKQKCEPATLSPAAIERLREMGNVVRIAKLVLDLIEGVNVGSQIYRLTGKFTRLPRMRDVFHALVDHAKDEAVKGLASRLGPVRSVLDTWEKLPAQANALERAIRSGDDAKIRKQSELAHDRLMPAKLLLSALAWAMGKLHGIVPQAKGLRDTVKRYSDEVKTDAKQLKAVAKCGLANPRDFGGSASAEVPSYVPSTRYEPEPEEEEEFPPRAVWEESDDDSDTVDLEPWMVQLSSNSMLRDAEVLHRRLRGALGSNAGQALIVRDKRDQYFCNVVQLWDRPDDELFSALEGVLGQGGYRRVTSRWCACPELRDVGGTEVVYCHAPWQCEE